MWTIIAFAERHDRHLVKHYIIPGLGLITNVLMLIAILYLYIIGNADAQHEAYICFAIAGGWALVSVLYVAVTGRRTGRAILAAPSRSVGAGRRSSEGRAGGRGSPARSAFRCQRSNSSS